ncbi:DinB family protein [Streptomyces sp. V4-01]|uniref:DinB family protein n=1 Tax=Actinacidiphila polyblastidii TaxID=3110430 RepID=A0ABU7PBG7_9ACTN|nr:DinB family protein [Streptomyces sp. V4-01]
MSADGGEDGRAGGPRRRAEIFGDAAADRRFDAPATGAEREVVGGVLRAQRATLELKCLGLGAELAARSVPPSTLSLLGLVRHLADVERRWFRQVLAAQDAPLRFSRPTAPDEDFDGAAADPALAAEAWRAWREEVAFAEDFAARAPDLDVTGHDTWRGAVSLRWVLVHMIEEYARHNGHADLLRERIDGAVGL